MTDEEPSVPVKAVDRERWTGIIFTFLSTFFYAISNVVVRFLAQPEYGIDNSWILFYKEAIGVAILLPWLFLRFGQGRFRFISKRLVLLIVIAAIVCQLIGAPLHVWGFEVVGLIITVPLVQSATLLGVAIMGYFIFGDSLSRRRKIAITILIVAMTILSIGRAMAADPQDESAEAVSAGFFLLVAAGVIVAGIAYAVYIVMMRYMIRQHWQDENSAWLSFQFHHWIGHNQQKQPGEKFYSPFPITLALAIVLGIGMVIFGTMIYTKQGIEGFYNVHDWAWQVILISGTCNLVGFFFQLQGLRMTSAVQAALIAVSQMLVLSLVGFLFFDELSDVVLSNVLVIIGLGLTACGVIMSAKPERPTVK